MRNSEARALTAKLAAAFPRDWVGELTEEVYVERLSRLASFEAARAAVDAAIDSALRLPSIASIREAYRGLLGSHGPKALEESPLSEEQRAENLRRIRELTDSIGRDPA